MYGVSERREFLIPSRGAVAAVQTDWLSRVTVRIGTHLNSLQAAALAPRQGRRLAGGGRNYWRGAGSLV